MKTHQSANQSNKFTVSILAAVACSICQNTYASEDTGLETIEVSTSQIEKISPATIQKSRQKVQEELIEDSRDLVRYTSDVGISDNGRHTKGFAMRGVEGNRVGISIDGISLPDSEENSLYGRYGNFNNARLGIDTELVSGIDLTRGSDSFESGSGALGGSVNYRTLEATDIVFPENKFGVLLKNAYASKNREWVHTIGTGYKDNAWDVVLMYSQRRGHEMKSNGSGEDINGYERGIPDPATHKNKSYLAKVSYLLNNKHRFSFGINGQDVNNFTEEKSYALFSGAWRDANDVAKRTNANLAYEYFPTDGFLSYAKLGFDWQKTDLRAVNYKGSGATSSNPKPLDEIYDRRMKTDFKRVNIKFDTQPWQVAGEHSLSFNLAASQRDFKNINYDTVGYGTSYESLYEYTIQYPVRTRQYTFSIQENSQWSEVFSSKLGARYDYAKVAPRNLNAKCSKACTAEGKPDGAKFANWTTFVNLGAQINPVWKLDYKLATGYRIPTASEMYFTFENAYGTWKSNPSLKAERSLTHNLSLQGNGDYGDLDIALHYTKYRNFLLEQENIIERTEYGRTYETPVQQMVNVDRAKVYGIEVKGHLNLDQVTPLPQGFKLFGALGYNKGKLSDRRSLLSIQPFKAIMGFDYEAPNGKWGIFSRITYLGAKKAKDAQIKVNPYDSCLIKTENPYYSWGWGDEYECKGGYAPSQLQSYKWRNNHATVVDLYAFYKPTKNITLRAGVYNLFNQKYHTWDALRGINEHSTTNAVDEAGKGLQRFYAPGRNYSAAVEIRF